ncbi:MAG: GTPase ObgE [Planctomycetes bacterium]|nr:GTPase ObgE [Planctomycetota bacterium]
MLDEIEIRVVGGRGGDGCLSFRREKFVPRGGPDGGDGGHGGSVWFEVDDALSSLQHLAGFAEFAAESGQPGGAKNCTGRSGTDRVLKVPRGTVVHDADRGNVLADLDTVDSRIEIARGGKGGRGNKYFATPTNRTPRQCEPGEEGEERDLRLVLKLIADVGLVGLPNAGKSTLLSVLSRARPKIAAYPFTTLEPSLGIVEAPATRGEGYGRSFVLADIPGLIEGAAGGKGLGHRFLRHVERTRLLLYCIDCSAEADQDPLEAYRVVQGEVEAYSKELASRPSFIAATKIESEAAEERAAELQAALSLPVHRISAAMHKGLDLLIGELLRAVAASRDA